MALGVNTPWGWLDGNVGVSGAVAFTLHHAMKLNVALYHPAKHVLPIPDDSGSDLDGRVRDVGLAWIWYPTRLWEGVTLELGPLWRHRDIEARSELPTVVRTESNTVATRMMIGRSWLIRRTIFVAIAGGFSAGYESGRETTSYYEMFTTKSIKRQQVEAEGYVRLGFVFGG